ncbi:unnamed protein product, partial [Laminaria digitata]
QVALVNEGYASKPIPGLPWVPPDSRMLRAITDTSGSSGTSRGAVGLLSQRRSAEEVMKAWGKSLALSVETPHGLCPGRTGCSRVWMYGSVAWGALRERCRMAAAELPPPPPPGGAGAGGGAEQGVPEALEVACAVGDVAARSADAWGLRSEHVCGAGPDGEAGGGGGQGRGRPREGGKWQRARVWSVGRYRRG